MKFRRSVAVAVVLVLLGSLTTPVSAVPRTTSFDLAGLSGPVELVVDKWGVPHIYASNTSDLFLAQGFNAARDRMFQMDLWLRRGLGRLSEAFGPSFVEQDRAARLFLYRGDMNVEWNSYGPDAKVAATRFAEGINAYITYLNLKPAELPVEFQRLGHRPARWTAEDVVRIRTHGPMRNIHSEVARSTMACVSDVEYDKVRARLEPDRNPRVPVGFDPCSLPSDVLDVYDLAVGGVTFPGGQPAFAPRPQIPQGSNNWAIGGSRSTTGRPMVATDPHRELTAPSLRYLVHLSAPGVDVIGAGEPSAPGVSLGHNGSVAFGLTIAGVDQEDLYVYELDPADPSRYRYGSGWERMTVTTEQVPVRDGPSRTVELRYTRHGPVIKVDGQRAFAVRTVWTKPGTSPYFGSVKHLRSRTVKDFDAALDGWGSPALNQVYADVNGDVGWTMVGLAPRRPAHDGLLPVPGDGRYEWDGFHAPAELPRVRNPEAGFVASANQYNLPAGYQPRLGFEWAGPARFERITEVLAGRPRTSPAQSMALQNDQVSLPARRIVHLLEPLSSTNTSAANALRLLRGWNADEHAGSAQAALFETWFTRYLGVGFVYAVLPPEAAEAIPFGVPDYTVMLEALENPDEWFEPGERDELLLHTLAQAYDDVVGMLGPDPAKWQWGDLHSATFAHPASHLVPGTDVGPLRRGGSWNTVNLSFFHPLTFQSAGGASVRLMMDVGNWDASQAVNAPGQSGDPASRHYRDLAAKWQSGSYFPLAYSRAAVTANASRKVVLKPL